MCVRACVCVLHCVKRMVVSSLPVPHVSILAPHNSNQVNRSNADANKSVQSHRLIFFCLLKKESQNP